MDHYSDGLHVDKPKGRYSGQVPIRLVKMKIPATASKIPPKRPLMTPE